MGGCSDCAALNEPTPARAAPPSGALAPYVQRVAVTVRIEVDVTVTDQEAIREFRMGRFGRYWGALVRFPARLVSDQAKEALEGLLKVGRIGWHDERVQTEIVAIYAGEDSDRRG